MSTFLAMALSPSKIDANLSSTSSASFFSVEIFHHQYGGGAKFNLRFGYLDSICEWRLQNVSPRSLQISRLNYIIELGHHLLFELLQNWIPARQSDPT
mmetsp:Transcript_9092/g.20622  ORF Transcript_9092/g.20622 Transcript_9092/m.20622 type:complete len:98 (-) Transcript_9092:953-1246(-)